MRMSARILCIAALAFAFVLRAQAVDTVVEGFEGTGNAAGWQSTSPAGQSQNITAQATLNLDSTAHVTQGTEALNCAWGWVVPGADAGGNSYISGGPGVYWSLRINVATPTALSSIPNSSVLRADVFNNTADTLQFSLCVRDDGGTGGLERGPFKPLAPNASTTYEWNMSTEAATTFVTGNSVLDGSSSLLRGYFIYTETQPTNTAPIIDVDNIRIIGAQSDLTAPATTVIYSAEQGSAPGKLLVKWKANTEPDLAEYRVYIARNSDFGSVIGNRFTFPSVPSAIVAAPATSTEIDVTTTEPVYVRVKARDNATPSPNESFADITLGAFLKASGSDPEDLVVLDQNRYVPGTAAFETNGYMHNIVYTAQALQSNNRRFASASGQAIDDDIVTLNPASGGMVIWSNALDGIVARQSVTEDNIAKLTTFSNANGKLFIHGIHLGFDMVTTGSVTSTAFYNNILKASLTNASVVSNAVVADGPFAATGSFFTGDDVFNVAGFATTANEGLGAQSGASTAMAYTGGAGGAPCVYYGNKVVYFGFGFESVREVVDSTGTFANAAAKRAALLATVADYLAPAPTVGAANWELYE
ncbi:MAG: hypothetical protein V2A74_08655 [bacterium]